MDKWFIIQTRPRWERKVAHCLEAKGIKSYCPVQKVKRKWSDRVKTLEEPLFKGYLFVHITADQRTAVRLTEGVINFLYRDGKPVQVKEKDIRAFKKLSETDPATTVDEEKGQSRKGKSFQFYLDHFNQWLQPCI